MIDCANQESVSTLMQKFNFWQYFICNQNVTTLHLGHQANQHVLKTELESLIGAVTQQSTDFASYF